MNIEELNKRCATLDAFVVTEVVTEPQLHGRYPKTTISYRLGSHTGTITEPDPLKAIEHIVRIVMLSD